LPDITLTSVEHKGSVSRSRSAILSCGKVSDRFLNDFVIWLAKKCVTLRLMSKIYILQSKPCTDRLNLSAKMYFETKPNMSHATTAAFPRLPLFYRFIHVGIGRFRAFQNDSPFTFVVNERRFAINVADAILFHSQSINSFKPTLQCKNVFFMIN
jgi:hypothetical protein